MATFPEPTFDDWAALAAKEVKGGSPADLNWKTPEGIELPILYTAADVEGVEHTGSLPGLAPYVRGPRATMYAGRPWTIRQYAGFSTRRGVQRILSPQSGGRAEGALGGLRPGHAPGLRLRSSRACMATWAWPASLSTRVEDMKILFDQIPLDKMSVSMTMNGAVLPIMAFYIVAAEEQGVAPERLAGTIQNDILKEFMVRNTYIYPPEPSHAHRRRYLRLHVAPHAALQRHLRLRLSHA